MTNRCLVVGDAPESVVTLIGREGFSVTRVRLSSNPNPEGAYLVLHIPDRVDDEIRDQLNDWLDVSNREGTRVGLTSAAGMSGDVPYLLFDPAVTPVMLLNDSDGSGDWSKANAYALGVFLARIDVDEEREDDVPIGRYFSFVDDPVQYRKQRMLSLASPSMQGFLQGLQDAVAAMSVPFPHWIKKDRRPLPPWLPHGPLTDKTKPPDPPSLADVFRLHASYGKAYLHTGERSEASEWSVPKLLVRGESGSGKTLVAELVHDLISRNMRGGQTEEKLPFVSVNCAALTGNNLQHELFGTAARAFSDITDPVVGSLATAGYGVAFLDEIGDLAPAAQRGILVFLGDGLIRPFNIEPYPGFVRIVAATNRDVPLLIERQQFRNDLNERFGLQIEIPPLRDRGPDEIARLIDFVALNPQRNPGRVINRISARAMNALLKHEYSNGNFRELETVVHRALDNARRQRSHCMRLRHVEGGFAEDLQVADRDANVINVSRPPQGHPVHVSRKADIERASALASSPILRTPDGAEYVLTRDCLFQFLPEASDGTPAQD